MYVHSGRWRTDLTVQALVDIRTYVCVCMYVQEELAKTNNVHTYIRMKFLLLSLCSIHVHFYSKLIKAQQLVCAKQQFILIGF